MGSGKSTAGKKLANRLNYRFIDLDKYIEEKEKKSISEIFKTEKEEGFRMLEKKYLRELNPEKETIISTGGGAPCFHENIDFMNQAGLTIYLKMNVDQLLFRLTQKNQNRPLLKGKSKEQMKLYIEELLKKRESCYKKAKWSVNGFSIDIPSLARDICNYFKVY
jgi:shikimate kinase